jgi:ribosomal protein L25 (general stress protein Ctc)
MTGLYFRKSGNQVMIDWNRYKGKNDSVAIAIDHRGIIQQFHKTSFYQTIFDP